MKARFDSPFRLSHLREAAENFVTNPGESVTDTYERLLNITRQIDASAEEQVRWFTRCMESHPNFGSQVSRARTKFKYGGKDWSLEKALQVAQVEEQTFNRQRLVRGPTESHVNNVQTKKHEPITRINWEAEKARSKARLDLAKAKGAEEESAEIAGQIAGSQR